MCSMTHYWLLWKLSLCGFVIRQKATANLSNWMNAVDSAIDLSFFFSRRYRETKVSFWTIQMWHGFDSEKTYDGLTMTEQCLFEFISFAKAIPKWRNDNQQQHGTNHGQKWSTMSGLYQVICRFNVMQFCC